MERSPAGRRAKGSVSANRRRGRASSYQAFPSPSKIRHIVKDRKRALTTCGRLYSHDRVDNVAPGAESAYLTARRWLLLASFFRERRSLGCLSRHFALDDEPPYTRTILIAPAPFDVEGRRLAAALEGRKGELVE